MTADGKRPRQAVILAGGRGTRLEPLTFTIPKPMIEFHGRPFVEYLIEHLREQGFERVLLLLGYLPEVIQNHFGDGSRFGIQISYSISDVENDTGTRLRLAKEQIEPEFLLLYCDNYWPMPFAAMHAAWRASGAPAQVTWYSNRDGYTRSNMRTDTEGFIEVYDRSRKAPGLEGVDIGFVLLKREVLDLLPGENCSFEQTVYPTLIAQHQLLGFRTDHRYYSVGSWERMALTEEFLRRQPAVFIDRDGVLNRKMPRAQYVRSWEEWEWLPGALQALRMLRESGTRVFIITNQPGVARGAMTREQLDDVHSRMLQDVEESGGFITEIFACTHDWNEGCDCRKPKPGMLLAAQRKYSLDLSRMVFFGDDERDGQAAAAAGCTWIPINDSNQLLQAVERYLSNQLATAQ